MRRLLFPLLVFSLLLAPSSPAGAVSFPETGFSVDGRFLSYWEASGGLAVFGYPISAQRRERTAEGAFESQWFERERFELHPENAAPYDVLLGRLGDEALRQQGRSWPNEPIGTQTPGCMWFAATRQSLCEPFLSYWRGHGLELGDPGISERESLALFGLPLTRPGHETNSSGHTVLTQWFERARFEHHPLNRPEFQVLLGRLGAEVFAPGRQDYDPLREVWPSYVPLQHSDWPMPLEVPEGFTVEEVARDLPTPRFMAMDRDGSLIYASHSTGTVHRLRDLDGNGSYDVDILVAEGLSFVHSVAFVNGVLYAAAEDRVVWLRSFDSRGRATSIETVIGGLPAGETGLYGHRTRTILPGPDGKLYLGIGSSCDVCIEESWMRAAVLRANPDGSGLELYASGLRNTVGLAFRTFTTELWGVDMGRNNIGVGQPPEELNHIQQGKHYGWPYCYGSRNPNPEFNDAARCAATEPPRYEFPAHWAPLGMVFYDGLNFPASYQGDALIAFHGSAPDQQEMRTGYSVWRVRFKDGEPVASEPLLRGFVGPDGSVWGRPAGILVAPDGSVLISDDHGGRLFRIRYVGRDGR